MLGPRTRCLEDGHPPNGNNWGSSQITPITINLSNLLFGDDVRTGQRAAVNMSLIHSAWINGHDVHPV